MDDERSKECRKVGRKVERLSEGRLGAWQIRITVLEIKVEIKISTKVAKKVGNKIKRKVELPGR